MKCPYCGGEVSVNDVRCPYCGNANPEGAAFQKEVHRRRKLNEYLRQKMREQLRLPLAQRILNLTIAVLALLMMLGFVLTFVWSLVRDPSVLSLGRPKDYEQQMDTLYTEGRYGELDAYMDRYAVEGQDYPQYTQMTLYHYTYTDYVWHSMCCIQSLDAGLIPDDYHLEYTIREAMDLFDPYIYTYPETYEDNQKALSLYQEEARCFLLGPLRLTSEEIAILYPEGNDGYVYSDEIEHLKELCRERLREEGYREETDE